MPKTIPPHVIRMEKEAAELSTRTDALSEFTKGDLFLTLSQEEMGDMEDQLEGMVLYRRALNHRVDRARRASRVPERVCPQCGVRSSGSDVICWADGADLVPLPESDHA